MTRAARARIVRTLIQRDGLTCHLCGGTFRRQWHATLDHVVPLSLGGTDDIDNLKLAHGACNQARGSGPVDAVRRMLAVTCPTCLASPGLPCGWSAAPIAHRSRRALAFQEIA